ncbi:MAG TPA: HlyD family secretion protein [Burkholderiales bacterium]|nr:HlyD family secretion protein [Burkholderiales bacterium]
MKPQALTHSKVRHRRLRWVFALMAIMLIAGISWWYFFLRTVVESNDAYVSGNVIAVQALVPGIVSSIAVDNSMRVQSGQWLLSEERNLAGARMEKAGADLAEAVRQTRSMFAQADSERANIAALNTQRRKLQADLARYETAQDSGAVSAQSVDDTQADIAVLDGRIAQAKAALRKAQALVNGTRVIDNPVVRKARATFVEAYIQYRRSNIFAPVDGYIADRQVEAGEQVKAGQRLMSIVPLDSVWITANLKETKLARVRTGQPVTIHAYIYGGKTTFHGTVIGIEPSGGSTFSLFPANNATGNYIHIVERVPVRIGLLASELSAYPLRLGTSVSIAIDVSNYRRLPALSTQVHTAAASYSTSIYRQEIEEARKAAQSIVSKNI